MGSARELVGVDKSFPLDSVQWKDIKMPNAPLEQAKISSEIHSVVKKWAETIESSTRTRCFGKPVCFVACHSAFADHSSTFVQSLVKKGYRVQIYASGPALKKFEERKIEGVEPFSLENISEEKAAIEVAKRCTNAAVVITDVGHAFDIALHKALAVFAPDAASLAYYDNPEPYVPGGYSLVAAQVMLAAQAVLFANANLAAMPIYQAPSQEVALIPEKKYGVGYYPISQAETIAARRVSDQKQVRAEFFAKHALQDLGQKVVVYTGGNNEDYFSKAFPAFLRFLAGAMRLGDLSNFIVVLQQHPGAKTHNIDGKLVQQWIDQNSQGARAPRLLLSELSSEDALVLAQMVCYRQTSIAPSFPLARIPTFQVGHDVYQDLLVQNSLCPVVTDANGLFAEFVRLQQGVKSGTEDQAIRQGLGIRSDWDKRLEQLIDRFALLGSAVPRRESVATSADREERGSLHAYLSVTRVALAVGLVAAGLFKGK